MSSSRKRTEHIERIRYPNPLPLPPYPPKLLSISTPSSRYADPRNFGTRLATAQPLPMVVDLEAGMPLNMSDFPQSWYTDQEIEADENLFPRLESADDVDEEDAFLLSDLLGKLPNASATAGRGGATAKEADKGNVTWLRRTEYLGAEKKKKERELMANRSQAEKINSSREGQLARIKATFAMANQPLSSLRHPTKPGLRAVEEHRVLPDPDTWATRYDVFRFGDPAGRTKDNKAISDPRLEAAILRPHLDLLEREILSLFLVNAPGQDAEEEDVQGGDDLGEEDRPRKTRKLFRSREEELQAEDDETERLLRSRREGEARDGEVQDVAQSDPFDVRYGDDEQKVHLNHIRDYEPHDESSRKDQELVFTFIGEESREDVNSKEQGAQGQLPPAVLFERSFRNKREREAASNGSANGAASTSQRKNVVYYHPVSTRASLRVRRRRVNDPRPLDHWDAISLGKRTLSLYEKIERLHERKTVDDMTSESIPARIELPEEDAVGEVVEEEDVLGDSEMEPKKGADSIAREPGADSDEDEDKDGEANLDSKKKGEEEVPGKSEVNGDEEEEEEEEGEEGTNKEQEGSDSNSESGSDDGTNPDEEMDEDELTALQADAGEETLEESKGGSRRSRAK